MIIMDLDGTLADCSHRRHFVDPRLCPEYRQTLHGDGRLSKLFYYDKRGNPFKPDWKAFYEACDQDSPIKPVIETFLSLSYEPSNKDVVIWSGRCESVREKTLLWLEKNILEFECTPSLDRILKMRPIGDNTPDDQLKEKWLDEALAEGKEIEMVFDDRKKVIDMWIRRGVFVFDVSQGKGDF